MVEPVAGAPSWRSTGAQWQPQPDTPPAIADLHRTFWRYMNGEEEKVKANAAAEEDAVLLADRAAVRLHAGLRIPVFWKI